MFMRITLEILAEKELICFRSKVANIRVGKEQAFLFSDMALPLHSSIAQVQNFVFYFITKLTICGLIVWRYFRLKCRVGCNEDFLFSSLHKRQTLAK